MEEQGKALRIRSGEERFYGRHEASCKEESKTKKKEKLGHRHAPARESTTQFNYLCCDETSQRSLYAWAVWPTARHRAASSRTRPLQRTKKNCSLRGKRSLRCLQMCVCVRVRAYERVCVQLYTNAVRLARSFPQRPESVSMDGT